MRSVWIEFVEPGGKSGGAELRESEALMASRRFLVSHEARGLPAAVVTQPLERGGPGSPIIRRGDVRITFNRFGRNDAPVRQEAERLQRDARRLEEVCRRLYDPIDPKEWRAGIARLNMRARTKAISSPSKKKRRKGTKAQVSAGS